MNIYVSNLSFGIGDSDLLKLFSAYGEVSSAKVMMDKFSGKSRGFGFVEMSSNPEAAKAIKELDGTMAEGRSIRVNEAKPKEEKSGGGFNRRW